MWSSYGTTRDAVHVLMAGAPNRFARTHPQP